MNILITGGAGYIGSHTCLELLNAGHTVVAVDNLCNSSEESLKRVQDITGKTLSFHNFDIQDVAKLNSIFAENSFDAVIHFAGLKAVGESVAQPLRYYRNNIDSTLSLLEAMDQNNVYSLVFSSSATVYGDPKTMPITEATPTPAKLTNPYGQTKLMIEHILHDLAASNDRWKINILRYFNPVGAHPSGQIGEDPNGPPNNLMPYISQVAAGVRDKVHVFGGAYDTPDGTGVRDYIHVVDLALGHLRALEHMPISGTATYNLGTGKGYSVLEAIDAFATISQKDVPYVIDPPRKGDVATNYADPGLAERKLDWKAERDLEAMIKDAWRWQSQNPHGYKN